MLQQSMQPVMLPYAGQLGPWGPAVTALPGQWPAPQFGVNVPPLAGAGLQQPSAYPGLGALGTPPMAGFNYELAPAAHLPSGDVALPLGDHLLAATKEKIIKGEFVDIFSLLFRELEKKDKEDLDEKDKEKLKKWKVDRNWASWLPGFFIYAGVISHAQLWRASALWQYADIIYKAYTGFSGPSWVNYDEEFRMRAALNPALWWDQIHPQLWLQVMTAARPSVGERSDSGHLVS